jgi:hypothetical protein
MRTGGTLLFLAAMGSGCSTIKTKWEYDHSADLSALRTYEWVGVRAARNEGVADRVREDTDRILVAQGLSAAGSAPDFTIVVYFDPEPVQPWEDAHREPTEAGICLGCLLAAVFHGDPRPSWRLWASPNGPNPTQTLRMEFLDPKTQQVVWRGCAKGPFDARMSEEKQARLVDRAVAKLLARFPSGH